MGALLELTRCSAAVRDLDAQMCATVTANTWIAIPCVSVTANAWIAIPCVSVTANTWITIPCVSVTANTWIAIPCVSVAEKFVFAYMGFDAAVGFGRMLGESVATENRDSASTSVGIAQMTGYQVVCRCGGVKLHADRDA